MPQPKAKFDGGALDCGSGLLLLIRKHIDPLSPGEVLEFTSTESSVEVDLPSWCNLTGNPFLSCEREGEKRTFLIEKGGAAVAVQDGAADRSSPRIVSEGSPVGAPAVRPIPEAAVLGIGSWPRPKWMVRAVHDSLSGKLTAEELEETARDAVRLAVEAQVRAGASAVTDGEQRRDSYASFAGAALENCQLIPLLDVLPYVDDPEEFKRELSALDIPASDVRHPMVFGKLRRARPLAIQESVYLLGITPLPVKVALPGPYLLTRMMWMDCVVDRAYPVREALAADLVQILREEITAQLALGVSMIQLDEPILTEIVFGAATKRRSFMCGILGEKKTPETELGFARDLLTEVLQGFPEDRLALHLCRGNWSPDETHALKGGYEPLLDTLNSVPVGTLFLEAATERAGSLETLKKLRSDRRLGIGVANQKRPDESAELVASRVKKAIGLFGRERLLFTPDCGFATFADNPITSAEQAEATLRKIADAVQRN